MLRSKEAHVGGDGVVLGRGGDENALGTGLEVLAGTSLVDEYTGALNDNVNAQVAPWELGRVTVADHPDLLPVHREVVVVYHLDVGFEGAQDGVILEKMGSLLNASRLVGKVEEAVLKAC